MQPIDVKSLAKLNGWTPSEVKDLFVAHSIPCTAINRAEADWRRLEALLKREVVSVEAICQQLETLLKREVSSTRVRLKGTQLGYNLIETYDHYMGLEGGKPSYEKWARLTTDDGRPAAWKLSQLEVIG
jgi:hypothetical protein